MYISHGRCARRSRVALEAKRALIFDCDGVIADSEYLHRDAYNEVFREFQLETYWSKECPDSQI